MTPNQLPIEAPEMSNEFDAVLRGQEKAKKRDADKWYGKIPASVPNEALPPLDRHPEDLSNGQLSNRQTDLSHAEHIGCRERQLLAALLRESAALEKLRSMDELMHQWHKRAESVEQELRRLEDVVCSDDQDSIKTVLANRDGGDK
jgi:hypothetical protein